jgi:hypothetical protein
MSKKTSIAIAVSVFILVVAGLFGVSLYSNIPKSPEVALQTFYEREVAEDQIMDPLILAGPGVLPLLEKEVARADMPNRRYAIGALGNLGSKASLPTLEKLARSTVEIDFIRCDALTAIAMIDHQQGLRVGNGVRGSGPACLSEIADHLARDYAEWLKSNAPRRTFFQALVGRHA